MRRRALAVARAVDRALARNHRPLRSDYEEKVQDFSVAVAKSLLTGGRSERHLGAAELTALVEAAIEEWER